eukprot:TRINITY_DN12726_c0_g1_i3.p1 TRINITY_DN12726_c0_g1~~TRINITY_DN12726_c0_g1_i3.p1  ORF type:complete len:883 (-),score=122.83 TRINITY_DN12726_c0_g1_i3:148-2796(-)
MLPPSKNQGPGLGLEISPPEDPRGRSSASPSPGMSRVNLTVGSPGQPASRLQNGQPSNNVTPRTTSSAGGLPPWALQPFRDRDCIAGLLAQSDYVRSGGGTAPGRAKGTESLEGTQLQALGTKLEDLQRKLFQILDAERSDRLSSFTRVESLLMNLGHELRPVIRNAELLPSPIEHHSPDQQPMPFGPGASMEESRSSSKAKASAVLNLGEHQLAHLQTWFEERMGSLSLQLQHALDDRLSSTLGSPVDLNKSLVSPELQAQAPLPSEHGGEHGAKLDSIELALRHSSRQIADELKDELHHVTLQLHDMRDAMLNLSGRSGLAAMQPTGEGSQGLQSVGLQSQRDHAPPLTGSALPSLAAELSDPFPPKPGFEDSPMKTNGEMCPTASCGQAALSAARKSISGMDKQANDHRAIKHETNCMSFLHTYPDYFADHEGDQLARDLGGRIGKFAAWWNSVQEPERSGALYRLTAHKLFERITMCVIITNAMFIVYGTNWAIDHLNTTPPLAMYIIEACFTVYYLAEIGMRLLVHRGYFFINSEAKWNVLDFGLVCLQLFDWATMLFDSNSINLAFLRVVRLLKLAKGLRALKAVRFFKALRLIMDCMTGSVMPFCWCMCFIQTLFAIFSLIFVQGITETLTVDLENPQLSEEDLENLYGKFGSVQRSMLTLFMAATGGDDWAIFYGLIELAGPLYAFTFLFFIAWFFLAAWNIVTGLFVEQAMKLALPDVDQLAHEKQMQDVCDARDLRKMLEVASGGEQVIPLEKVDSLIHDTNIANWLHLQGVMIKDTQTFVHMLSSSGQESSISLEMFIEGCMRLRGHSSAMDLQMLSYETEVMRFFTKTFYENTQQKLNWLIEGLLECSTCLEQHLGHRPTRTLRAAVPES